METQQTSVCFKAVRHPRGGEDNMDVILQVPWYTNGHLLPVLTKSSRDNFEVSFWHTSLKLKVSYILRHRYIYCGFCLFTMQFGFTLKRVNEGHRGSHHSDF